MTRATFVLVAVGVSAFASGALAQTPPTVPSPVVRTTNERPDGQRFLDPLGLTLSGYVQVQHETSQLSEDQIQQGGIPYNQDRFLVRRARLRLDGSWRYATTVLEFDGSTTRGPYFGLRRAEASLVWRNPQRGAPPYVALTAGLTEMPFGYELVDGVRRRLFMERSLGSLAFFRGEPDVGVRLSGAYGIFRASLALMNGQPLDDRAGVETTDPTARKDFLGRIGVDTGETRGRVQVTGGVSFLSGTGFHRGSEATDNRVVWRDLNENSQIDGGELTALPGQAATPSMTFSRWAVNADLGVRIRTRLGLTHVYGEITVASNLDRGVYVADPVATGYDIRHLAYYVAVTQEIFRYGLVGFRYDSYDPNLDALDSRRGRFVPNNATVTTLSPLVGVAYPGRGRLVLQYDVIQDSLARNTLGVPTDLRNNQWTLRLQAEF